MEIEQFVKTTLNEIAEGTKCVSSGSGEKHFYLDGDGVEFDLAVSVSEQKQREAKGSAKMGIKVVGVNGDFVDARTGKSEYVSRVKFTVRFGNEKGRVINHGDGTLSGMS